MKRLTVKVFFLLLLSFLIMNTVMWLLLRLVNGPLDKTVQSERVLWVTCAAGFSGYFSFVYLMNRAIIKRVKTLNRAMKIVGGGSYDIELVEEGRDELSELTVEFNKMTGELKANEYLSRDFVKNISHELKTPLSSIKGFADLINARDLPREEVQEYAAVISKEAERLSRMSRNMLLLSYMDSTNIFKKDEIFVPAEHVRSILLLMQKEWLKKNITVDAELSEYDMKGSEELTHHIFQNLISNAVKYTGEGGTVKIELTEAGGRMRFRIEDNGAGIPEEDKPHIFKQFYTADKSRSGGGSGLGLSLTKKIVEKLGGHIRFESTAGAGTVFEVEL
jgi:signal transduction histidine kinase